MTELHPDEQHVFLQCLNKMQKELDLSFERYERLFKTTQELQVCTFEIGLFNLL